MADGGGGAQVIGTAVVDVSADTSKLDARFDALPAQVGAKVQAASAAAATATVSLTAGLNGVSQSGGMAAQRMLILGNFMDDAQYGIRGIVNNVPQLVQAFGGTAGMAGAIGIAMVAINQLVQHWPQIAALFGDDSAQQRAARSIEGLTKRVKELKEEVASAPTVSNITELAMKEGALRKAEQAKSAGDALEKGQSEASKKSREAAIKAVNESGDSPGEGYNRLAVDLASRAALTPETQAQQQKIAAAEAELQAMKAASNNTAIEIAAQKEQQGKIAELKDALRLMEVKAAKAQIDAAMGDPDRLKALAAQVTDAKLKAALLDATPEAMQEKARRDALNKRDDEMGAIFGAPKAIAKVQKEQEKANAKAEAEAAKLFGEMNNTLIDGWKRDEAEVRKKSDELARSILKNPALAGATPGEGQVRDMLDKAGFGDKDLDGTTSRVMASVKRLAGEKDAEAALSGANGPLAEAQAAARVAELQKRLRGNAGQMQSIDSFVNSVAGAALQGDAKKEEKALLKEQLTVAKATLAELQKKKPGTFR